MGNQQKKGSKGARTGAPLTRRQQKQLQRRPPKQQRQAQTMPPARQELRHQPEMRILPRPQDTLQPAVRLDAGAAPAGDKIGDEDVISLIVDIETKVTAATEATEPVEATVAAAAQTAGDEATPPRRRNLRVAARGQADTPVEPLEQARATKPTMPVARKHPAKYPTLARMAAIAPAAPTASTSLPAHPVSLANATPLPSADVPTATPSATQTGEATTDEVETLAMLSPAAMRAEHAGRAGNTDMNRAAAPDGAPDTHELRAVVEPRKPVTTRRLAEDAHLTSSDTAARRLESAAAKAIAGAREARRQASQTSRAPDVKRPRALPEVDLVLPVAAGHIIVTFAAALTGTILLLVGQDGAIWPLTLAIVLGVGAWLAYIVSHRSTARSVAGSVLLASQLAALGWAFALLGARASLLALAPAMLLLALRTAGRLAMGLGAGVVFALYLAAELSASALPVSGPAFSPTQLAVIDGVVVFVGLFTMLVLALDLQHGHIRALAHARANRHEARLLRERTTLLRQQLEEDAALLDEGLGEALHGRGIDAAALEQVDSMLSPLVERVIAVADRMETLQRDREDRLRLEGAVRQVTRALERGWLGLPWTWPDLSGTLLDELVALLRAPNPRQMPLWREETPPTLVPIPSLDSSLTPRPWDAVDAPAANPYVRPDVRAGWPTATNHPSLPDRSDHHAISTRGISGVGWPTPIRGGEDFSQQTAAEPRPAYARANPLPWDEWDTWGTWDAARRDD